MKEINIKNGTYHFFDDMINIKNFDSTLLKIDKKSYKNIDIYYIGYITMKNSKYVNIHSVNPLYLTIGEINGSIEEKNGNKYLTFASTDKNKEVLEKNTKIWDVIKELIDKIDNKPGEYQKDYMKIKFSSDDSFPLNKPLKLYMLTIIARSAFKEDGKYYLQIFLDERLYEV